MGRHKTSNHFRPLCLCQKSYDYWNLPDFNWRSVLAGLLCNRHLDCPISCYQQYDTYCQNVPRYIPRLTPWKRIEVVAAVIRKGDRIFATQRGYGDWKDWWEFPGGKMEVGETPEGALVREISEELSADISVDKFLCTVEHDYPAFHLTMHCYLCSLLTEALHLNEHEAARWLTKDELDSVKWLPADMEVVEELLRVKN